MGGSYFKWTAICASRSDCNAERKQENVLLLAVRERGGVNAEDPILCHHTYDEMKELSFETGTQRGKK
jgi:hypothetical protein